MLSENQQLFEEAFLPTLKTLTRAPTSSPLSEINEVNVANFLIELTDAQHLVENVKDNAVVTVIGRFVICFSSNFFFLKFSW